jgi:hypothetical protein
MPAFVLHVSEENLTGRPKSRWLRRFPRAQKQIAAWKVPNPIRTNS